MIKNPNRFSLNCPEADSVWHSKDVHVCITNWYKEKNSSVNDGNQDSWRLPVKECISNNAKLRIPYFERLKKLV